MGHILAKLFLKNSTWYQSVSFKGKNGGIIQAFSYGTEFKIGQKTELELDSISAELEWDVIFSENRKKEIKVERKGDWEYEAYGKVLSINPVYIDFGEFELNTGNWTNDKKIIGEFIYWKIDRLDI